MHASGLFRFLLRAATWSVLVIGVAWAFGAIFYDFPIRNWRHFLAIAFVICSVGAIFYVRPLSRAKLGVAIVILSIASVWLSLKPRNDRAWQSDVAKTAWAQVDGDRVTFHNVRNFDYHHDTPPTPHWETRTVRLSQLTGLDLAVNYWGSPWMAHPIASFQFSDAPPLCFSIETRREIGEDYSAIGGLYRQYELVYIVADERDVFRLRLNTHAGEDIYLYRTTASPAQARARFLEYIAALNALHAQPRWYNAIATNCTTAIRDQRPVGERTPWDWRILLNGKGDEMMYDRHSIVTAGLAFPELKRRSLINDSSRAADADPDFSRRIRATLPGMAEPTKP
jgi:hypothetical protein